jgi:DNA-binding CsgD family transcriptional regulator
VSELSSAFAEGDPRFAYAAAVAPSRLSDRDYRTALDFVGEAYDAQDREEFRAAILPGYDRLVGCEWASYNELIGTTPIAAIVEPELPQWAYGVWEEVAAENPLLLRYLRTRDGRAVRFSDIVPLPELRRMPIFSEFYSRLGVDRQIAFVLPSTPELTIAVALSRGGRDFNERDRALIELTRPHLIQAYRAAELRETLVATIAGLRSGVEAEGGALVVLAADGTVRFASARAHELSEDALGEPLVEGEPPPDALAARPGEDPEHLAGDVNGASRALLVRRVKSGTDTVLVLGEPERELSVTQLRLLGLTRREAEVLESLAAGGSTTAVATGLGISERTLAKHVQKINAKLGVRNRSQAIATAWAAAAPPRAAA